MAVYNSLQPLSQVADLPEFMQPSWFRKRNGQSTAFGNVFNAAVPALTTIAGTVLGGPAGTAIGQAAGQAIVGGVNRLSSAEAGKQGAEDAQAVIDESLGQNMAMANLTSSIAGMVGISPGITGTNGGPNVPASLRLNPLDGDALPGLVGSAAGAFGRKPPGVRPMGSQYQVFADGGIVEPIPTTSLPMNAGGRERRRQQRLADGLAERVERELDQNAAAQAEAADRRAVAEYQAGRIAPPAIVRTQENRPQAVRANLDGANYTRNWMAGRGYSGFTGDVMTPELVRPADFVQNTGLSTADAAGVYMPTRDRSYAVDFYDKNRTRSVATHEAAHDAQDALQNTAEMQQSLATLGSRVKPGSDQYLGTPEEVQARLMQMREGISQDPGKKFNRWKWRLGNVANTLSFGLANRAQNEAFRDVKGVMGRKAVFDSLDDTFAGGGKPGRGSYNRYAWSDKTSEDMLMIDKTTGKKVGEMRYGERIYDQEATDKIDRAVRILKLDPTPQGFAWLGNYVYHETKTHPDHRKEQAFADGGTPSPVTPTPSQKAELDKNRAWLRNWYQKRQIPDSYLNGALEKDRADLLKPVPYPTLTDKPVEEYAGGAASFGRTYPGTKKADVWAATTDPNHYNYLTDLHENTHQTMQQNLFSRTTNDMVVKDQILPYEKSGFSGQVSKEIYDKHLGNTDEVSARLMAMRKLGGFQPDKPVTVDDFDGFMEQYQTGKIPANQQVDDILKMTGRDQQRLLNLLNFTTRADEPRGADQRFADGGKPESPAERTRKVQQQLKDAGLYAGPVNGIFDATTQEAVYAHNRKQRNNVPAQITVGEDEQGNKEIVALPNQTVATPQKFNAGDFVYEKETKIKPTPLPATPKPPIMLPEVTVRAPRINYLSGADDVVGTLPPVPEAKPAAPVAPGTNWMPDRTTVKQQAQVTPDLDGRYNILSPGNIADAARVFMGYSQASRPLPENPINADYLKLVSEARASQNDGLGPASRKLYKDQMDDSRSIAIESLRRTSGGGGSAGAVLGGLGTINDATSTAALKLAAADEQTRMVNSQRYERLLGGQIGMEDQRFASVFNAGLRNQQAGVNLVQQGMQGLQGRYDFWNNYDRPGSAGARYGALQIANEEEALKAAKRSYGNAGRILTLK